jgi:hypothetical protein
MKHGLFTTALFSLMVFAAAASAAEPACGTLAGPAGGFQLRSGEPVSFSSGGKTVPGALHIFREGDVFRVYWQPNGSPDQYSLANAGNQSIRLIATPPQGTPASAVPDTTLPPQQVLSCPSF